ncbi:MAG: phosphate acyltransferase PlsX [Candidatus Babeliales bacterium]|jgi:glycerol-3-phosphate acyltransferase PlsX
MIALDVMGGDHAPAQVLQGALMAARKGVSIALFGPEQLVRQGLTALDISWENYGLLVVNAPDCVAMDDEPVSAVVKKKHSSLVMAVASLKEQRCGAVVSAGNSGALMVAALLLLGKQEGIDRAAIAGFLPSCNGQRVLALDLGANTECRPEHLYQFAQCASGYLTERHGVVSPRVALLSNGHEAGKGSQLVKQTHELLKGSKLNFIGNCEPYALLDHSTDIIVCDGFAGNVLLKTLETSFRLFQGMVRTSNHFSRDVVDTIGQIIADVDYRRVGGALLLGVKGNVIVCHGDSDAIAIENALCSASKIVSGRYSE